MFKEVRRAEIERNVFDELEKMSVGEEDINEEELLGQLQ